jgi:serine/threonine protein kinase/Tfp pilus assembly protein PilF
VAIKCPKCNADNPDTMKFCGECGTRLPTIEDIDVTETMEAPKEELITGTTFAGRYQIIEELGKGGMGKVYRALDKELNEEVAIKLIKPKIAKDKETIERFKNELKIARRISHRNVGRMYELMEDRGSHFITMEYVPGQDLRGLIRQTGQLTTGKAIAIAKEICEGLEEAHHHGVVHRDLKPSNIIIDRDGNARILDFGIAKSIAGKAITDAGVMIGTPEYMSPEQVEGKEVDFRSDIYSLGIILFEMTTGRVPFEGDTPFTVGVKHKSELPKNPKDINSQIPDDLNNVIIKCLEKEKEKRYQNAGEVRSELANIEMGIPTTDRVIPKGKPITSKEITVQVSLKKLFIPILVIFVLATLGIAIWRLIPKRITPLLKSSPSIGVLPFVDLSPQKDQEYFCDGVTDEIITKLSRLDRLKVIPRTSMMRFKDIKKDIKEIGQELDVTAILEGSVRKEKDDIRITATLINVADSTQLWSDTYDQKLESVFAIQSDIAEEIANSLMEKLSPEEKTKIQEWPTDNLEAYNLYLQGRFFWNIRTEEALIRANEYFEQAIKIDRNYALAYTGLADSYNMMGAYSYLPSKDAFLQAKAAAEKALEIDESLAEAHVSITQVKEFYEWDWSGAEKEYNRAIELNTKYATAHQWYAEYLSILGRHNEAMAEIKKAQELDPLSPIINVEAGRVYYFAQQYDQAIKHMKKAFEIDPNFVPAHFFLAYAYVQKGMYQEAISELQKATTLTRSSTLFKTSLAYAFAVSGDKVKAKELLGQLIELSKERYVSAYEIAEIYVGLGEKNLAIDWLQKAFDERSRELVFLKVEPRLDSIRSDPRFNALLVKMNLEK